MSRQLLDISDFDTFNKQPYDKGVLTLNLTSWDEFHSVVKKFNNYPDYIWRGQKYAKPLKSSFDRLLSYKGSRQEELKRIFNKLKQRLMDLRKAASLTDNEIWAIGQHYGLSTPLLDWTESPYFAAYFSFYEKSSEPNRVIYALNKVIERVIQKTKNLKKEVLKKERFVDFDPVNNNLDFRQNERMISQRGKFTQALEGKGVEWVVEKFWEKRKNQYKNKIILTKILIPDEFQNECLTALKAMNITHGTLFPDYAGAVEICKIDLGIEKSQNSLLN